MKQQQRILAAVLLEMMMTAFAFCACAAPAEPEPESAPFLEVLIIDVKKADAIILKTPNHSVLIDSGNDEDGEKILAYLQEYNIDTLDYLIITHFDKDHLGGATTIISYMPVKNVIQPDYFKDNKRYELYCATLELKGITPLLPTETVSFVLDGAEFSVHPPRQENYKKENNYSLVTSVKYGENSFYFTGDAMAERLQELLDQGELAHDFLKVPHHGNHNKKTDEFIAAVGAKYAVITSSFEEPADKKTLKSLEQAGTEYYLSENGDVYCRSDGNSIEIFQE